VTKQGWPQILKEDPGKHLTGEDKQLGSAQVSYADLDGDGDKEVIVSGTHMIAVWNAKGQPVAGWPKNTRSDEQKKTSIMAYHAIGDLDGDGDLEIVVATDYMLATRGPLLAYHHDGTEVADFKASIPGGSFWRVSSPFVVSDVDGDGRDEIILTLDYSGDKTDPVLTVLDGKGNPLSGWPQELTRSISVVAEQRLAVTDFDGNGKKEVVVMYEKTHESDNRTYDIVLARYEHDGRLQSECAS
jgi:uncharacterized protein YrzB (UPF0473 family)